MQQNDKMHPDDMRNLIIFGIASILLWLSYDNFILQPKMEKMRAAQEVQQQAAIEQIQSGAETLQERDRVEVISQTSGGRVSIDNDQLEGSINLKGARLDDLILKNYHKTI